MFDLLASQAFTLHINLIQTAFSCDHPIAVYRYVGYSVAPLRVSNCQTNYNNSVLSLAVLLPAHTIYVELSLFGTKTIGGVSLGLSGSSTTTDNGR